MCQHRDAPKVFKEFLSIVRPARILEIGTFHGGLTLMLRDIMDEIGLINNPIRTYDIHEQEFLKPLVIDRKVEVYTKNLFNNDYSDWSDENSKQEINDYINTDGITMVLCDGGCKKCEFNLIAPCLKKQDIIMAHDYAPNNEYFEQHMRDKIWNWHEIQDSDIINVSTENNLQTYLQVLMQKIAWCSRERR
jgi:hypothetical protein